MYVPYMEFSISYGGTMSKSLLDTKNEHYVYEPIAYHDSWLSVDPIIGCRLDCQYCFMQSSHWTAVNPEHRYTVPEIIDILTTHQYFVPHETVLSFGNQTDSFLADNVDYTLRFFEALEQHELENPVVVVTKKRIPRSFSESVVQFKHLRPIFCLSYSGLPGSIERGVNPKENQDNFMMLSDLGLRVIHFWRPMIAINGSTEVLEKVLDFVARYSMASVYIGLKVNPQLTLDYAQNQYLRLPEELDVKSGDYLPRGAEERLRTLAAEKHPDYPLYKHSSCAVSYALSIPDYNGTVYHDPICKGSNCPAWKRKICEDARDRPTSQKVQDLFSRLGLRQSFAITEHAVEISGEISQEEFAFLLHRLNYPLRANVRHTRNLWGSIFRSSATNYHKDGII